MTRNRHDAKRADMTRMRLVPAIALALCVAVSAADVRDANDAHDANAPANLLRNGDFERIDPNTQLPVGWSTKHPDNVRAVKAEGRDGWAVEMTGGRGLMGSYGVDLLSAPIEFKPSHRYRLSGHVRSAGPSFIAFVKGYATVTRIVDGEKRTYDDAVYQMKKQIGAAAAKDRWTRFTLDFDVTPARIFSDHQHEVKYLRVLLWAYWPAGTCWYDDVKFVEVGPLPDDRVRHGKAMTHTGEPSNVADRRDANDSFDAEQAWVDAANAYRAAEYARALAKLQPLLASDEAKVRLLAARTLTALDRHDEAKAHVAWLADPNHDVRTWQRQMARITEAKIHIARNQPDAARKLIDAVLADDPIAVVEHAARQLLEAMEREEQ